MDTLGGEIWANFKARTRKHSIGIGYEGGKRVYALSAPGDLMLTLC